MRKKARGFGRTKSGRADAHPPSQQWIEPEEGAMNKRRAQQRKRVAKKVSNLSTPVVDQAEAVRVTGGEAKKSTAPPETTTYMSYTLENTMISSYS
jgi:hypothetical protein